MARSAAAMTPRFDHAALLPMTATLHSERAGVKGGMQSASSRQATKSAGGGGTGGGDGGGGDGEDEDMLITRRRSAPPRARCRGTEFQEGPLTPSKQAIR